MLNKYDLLFNSLRSAVIASRLDPHDKNNKVVILSMLCDELGRDRLTVAQRGEYKKKLYGIAASLYNC